jgi:hypothetical protein
MQRSLRQNERFSRLKRSKTLLYNDAISCSKDFTYGISVINILPGSLKMIHGSAVQIEAELLGFSFD